MFLISKRKKKNNVQVVSENKNPYKILKISVFANKTI